jgi:hypothetical protein
MPSPINILAWICFGTSLRPEITALIVIIGSFELGALLDDTLGVSDGADEKGCSQRHRLDFQAGS